MVHIISSHKSYKAEYKYNRDACQQDRPKGVTLEVDASLFAIGAVLFQRDEEGLRRPISYFSQALNPAKRNYDIWDREFLAIIRGLKHN